MTIKQFFELEFEKQDGYVCCYCSSTPDEGSINRNKKSEYLKLFLLFVSFTLNLVNIIIVYQCSRYFIVFVIPLLSILGIVIIMLICYCCRKEHPWIAVSGWLVSSNGIIINTMLFFFQELTPLMWISYLFSVMLYLMTVRANYKLDTKSIFCNIFIKSWMILGIFLVVSSVIIIIIFSKADVYLDCSCDGVLILKKNDYYIPGFGYKYAYKSQSDLYSTPTYYVDYIKSVCSSGLLIQCNKVYADC